MLKIYRINEVSNIIGLTANSIWRKVKSGDFPTPIRIGPNSIGWRHDQIQGWIESRPAYKPDPHVIPPRGAR